MRISDVRKELKIGVIHAALGSAPPLSAAIRRTVPAAQVINFVNEEMLQYVNRNDGVDARAMRMFAEQVFHAEEAGVDIIVVACNVFAPRIDDMLPFITVPILAVDRPMQKRAAAIGGKIGVMGTNNSAFPACCSGIRKAAGDLGVQAPVFVDGTVAEAAQMLVKGDTESFDRVLTEKALQLVSEGCIAIVLSQVTMARAKEAMEKAGIDVPILTSPDECAERIREMRL